MVFLGFCFFLLSEVLLSNELTRTGKVVFFTRFANWMVRIVRKTAT